MFDVTMNIYQYQQSEDLEASQMDPMDSLKWHIPGTEVHQCLSLEDVLTKQNNTIYNGLSISESYQCLHLLIQCQGGIVVDKRISNSLGSNHLPVKIWRQHLH